MPLRILFTTVITVLSFTVTIPNVSAQTTPPPDEYMRGTVINVASGNIQKPDGSTQIGAKRITTIRLNSDGEKGTEATIEETDPDTIAAFPVTTGDSVVVIKSYSVEGVPTYAMVDTYRIPRLWMLAALFFVAALLFGKLRGASSVLGLIFTAVVIVGYVVPQIMDGQNPLTVSLVASVIIIVPSLYLAHGINARTTIALASTLVTLAGTAWVATHFVGWARLSGSGSDDAFFLQGLGLTNINLQGLLLGGMMLGVLGILDDITTAQSAIVEELKRANAKLSTAELYRRGLSVGREHITSLINTLFLAYAGVSLPLFLLFRASNDQPLWFIVNSEPIAEEIVRTLVGSLCLVVAVPITTFLAALWFGKKS